MDPITGGLALASLGSTALGGIMGGKGQSQQYQAQQAMYYYQAGIALDNQQIEKQNKGFALQQGEQQAMQSGMRTRAQVGEIKAAQGASGFDLNKGTQPMVPAGQEKIGQIDQATIRSNANKAAFDYDVSAFQYGAQATVDQFAAANAAKASGIAQESSILGTAAGVSSKWLGFEQSGALPSFGSIGSSIGKFVSGF
jgi:hypothetical protein